MKPSYPGENAGKGGVLVTFLSYSNMYRRFVEEILVPSCVRKELARAWSCDRNAWGSVG